MTKERKSQRQAKPTDADKAAAARLKVMFEEFLAKNNRTQEDVADVFKPGGASQGLISQYINGALPLGLATVIRFAIIMNRHPTEIRDDLPELQSPVFKKNAQEQVEASSLKEDTSAQYILESEQHPKSVDRRLNEINAMWDGINPIVQDVMYDAAKKGYQRKAERPSQEKWNAGRKRRPKEH